MFFLFADSLVLYCRYVGFSVSYKHINLQPLLWAAFDGMFRIRPDSGLELLAIIGCDLDHVLHPIII